ncbi:MAG: hypothetical protein COA78_03685 [Blastopirellula sp.]|nr:MAG: hypothetical protein COA78_03685 [Blastopirellula sp.]
MNPNSNRLFRLSSLLLIVFSASSLQAGLKDGKLDIYWVDVEGGAATLIVTPAGESVLIDTGNPGRRDPDRIVQVAVKRAGLRKIDYLITTHYHRDHFGGASMVAKMIPIGQVYDNATFDDMPNDPGREYFEFKAEGRHQVNPGDTIPLKQLKGAPKLSLTCIGTRRTFISPPKNAKPTGLAEKHKAKDRDGSDNANSVVMLLKFGDFEFFHSGDLTWNQEVKLVAPYNLVGEVDVYQVAHHGLASSNNPVVLMALKPTVAIMNNGTTKGCSPDTFAALKGTDSIQAIYQAHKNLREDGATNNTKEQWIANQAKDCKGHHIELSVDVDSKSYTVAIPANDHSQKFMSK